jgi:2-polyprenyl-3-methyl-5-hydroxy-6-metoxy-1,4-benzoquinol methylase
MTLPQSTTKPPSESLSQWRKAAAECSGGTSQQHLYDDALRWLSVETTKNNLSVVMDYGAGTGALALQLSHQNQGLQIIACDIMPPSPELPKQITWIEQDLNSSLPENLYGSVDILFSIETIEHLENPRQQFREWARLLQKGGTAYITTPNPESWHSLGYLLFKGVPSSLSEASYPAHLLCLGAIELKRCAQEAGFTKLKIEYSNRGRIPFFKTRYWQNTPPFSLFARSPFGSFTRKFWSDTVIIKATRG